MYAIDFEYDGQLLSDYGCMVCDFDGSSGAVFANAGSSITFNKISRNFGRTNSLSGIQYDECVTATFDICKSPELAIDDNYYLTSDECRDIMRWLNRGSFHKFRIVYDNEDIDDFYYNASFNIEKIKIGERVCGLRLTMETDKPYAYGIEVKKTFSVSESNIQSNYSIKNLSDDISDTYPSIHILCNASGDLEIANITLGQKTVIRGCEKGEQITIDGNILMLKTSSDNNIWGRFNYVFPQMTSSLNDRNNVFNISLPCTITISYVPIIKESI